MRQRKTPAKKEKNYSIWFTGIVLVLVYMIILNDMSGAKNCVYKSNLMDRIQDASESAWDLMKEKEAEPAVD